MYKKFGIILIIGALISFGIFTYSFFFDKDFHIMNYKESITIDVNGDYQESVPNVCYGSLYKCKEVSFIKEGSVDSTKLGDYNLVFQYKIDDKELVLEEKVSVVDLEKPVIKVLGDIKACPNGKIWDQKYEAYDNYDGDLTSKVVYVKENEKYYLSVTDSSNNETRLETDILVSDEEPTITLKGDSKVYLLVGKKYSEKGYTATDTCDGDLTDKVTVKNNVNSSKAGTYQVTYSVTDSSGNKKSVIRQVVVFKKNNVFNPSNKTIYLTFDDGPGPYTGKLLNILDEYDVKVTFFVTNQFPSYQKYIKEAYNRGHSIGIHTYSHDFKIYSSVESYFSDLNKMSDIIKKQTGVETKIVRFPGGSSNTVSKKYSKGIMKTLANELEARGYSYFDWDLGSGDTDGLTTSSAVAKRVISNLKGKTRNVLMHDIKSYSVEAVREIIEYGLANGYTFAKINLNSPTFHHTINN